MFAIQEQPHCCLFFLHIHSRKPDYKFGGRVNFWMIKGLWPNKFPRREYFPPEKKIQIKSVNPTNTHARAREKIQSPFRNQKAGAGSDLSRLNSITDPIHQQTSKNRLQGILAGIPCLMTSKRAAHIQSSAKPMILTVAPWPRCAKKDLPDFLT